MKFIFCAILRFISTLLILMMLFLLSSCQPPDYGETETTFKSKESSSSIETDVPAPNPFGSAKPYTSHIQSDESDHGTYFYDKYIYTVYAGRKILRIDRETGEQALACMHEAKKEKCYFCNSEYQCKNLYIDGNILYTAALKKTNESPEFFCIYQNLDTGKFGIFPLPCADSLYAWNFFVFDGHVYYVSMLRKGNEFENTGSDFEYEFSRIQIGGTEREILSREYRGDYIYNGTLYGFGYVAINMQTWEARELLTVDQIGDSHFESYFYYGNCSYLSMKNLKNESHFDLYRLNLDTGEYKKLLEGVITFCIMEEGIYYRTPGEYESKYVDANGKHPKRFERDLYRCDLDGSNPEVVFSSPDVMFLDLAAVVDGYAYGMFRIYSSAKSKKNAYLAFHLASGTYREIIPYSDADVVG